MLLAAAYELYALQVTGLACGPSNAKDVQTNECCHTLVALLQQEDTLWGAVHVQHSSSSGWPPLPPASAAAETSALRQ